jgi:CDP-glucose 4,6-dehydratase
MVIIMIDPTFWRNRNVFVTGHTGFKGTWLSLWLHALGASVTGYSLNPPTQPNLFELCRMDELITSHIADIRNPELLSAALSDAAPDIVFHMAAQPHVRESYKNPAETFEINIMGTVHLLDAVRKASQKGIPIRAVINITTDKCYDNREWPWGYRETDPLGGHDPYSSSKACSELITASYRDALFNPKEYAIHQVSIATVRAGNVIGGGDWAKDRLIPDCIRALIKGEQVKIRYPESIRPWQHVLEPLHGYLLLAQKLAEWGPPFAQGWNFGPNDHNMKPVMWVVKRICEIWGGDAAYQIEKGAHPHEARYLKLDCSKAKQDLGWHPQWNLDTALTKIVEWMKAYQEQSEIRVICLNQIRDYMETVKQNDH